MLFMKVNSLMPLPIFLGVASPQPGPCRRPCSRSWSRISCFQKGLELRSFCIHEGLTLMPQFMQNLILLAHDYEYVFNLYLDFELFRLQTLGRKRRRRKEEKVLVLLSASVERFFVSRMRNFFALKTFFYMAGEEQT